MRVQVVAMTPFWGAPKARGPHDVGGRVEIAEAFRSERRRSRTEHLVQFSLPVSLLQKLTRLSERCQWYKLDQGLIQRDINKRQNDRDSRTC